MHPFIRIRCFILCNYCDAISVIYFDISNLKNTFVQREIHVIVLCLCCFICANVLSQWKQIKHKISMECTWHSRNTQLTMNRSYESICTETLNRNLWMYWMEISINLAFHSLNTRNRLCLIFLLTQWWYYATFNLAIKVQMWTLKLDFELI